jgi:hypothetical protein
MSQKLPMVFGATGLQQLQSGDQLFGITSVNVQTGTTYTVVTSDTGKLVTHTNASPVAVTLPIATTPGFASGWHVHYQNRGAGTITITPATSTIDGAANISLTAGQGLTIWSDGSNYFTVRGMGLTANQTITLSGDVIGSGTTGIATTIATNTVTYAKFQTVAASSLIGNPTGGFSNAQGISLGSTLAFSGTAVQTVAFTGDVTTAANSFATTVVKVNGVSYPSAPSTNTVPVVTGVNTITYQALPNSAMATMPTLTLKGNNTGGAAVPADLTVAQVMTMLGAAPLASPTFTGIPAAPTASPGTSTTQIATTAFVGAAISASSYVLPAATVSTLGGVIVGAGLAVTGGGTLSANVTTVAGRTGAVTISSTDITDATTTGRAVLTAGSILAARVSLKIDQRTTVADIAYTMVAGDYNVQYTSISAARSVTLPAASTLNPGQVIIIGDSSGNASANNTITVTRTGADSINGLTTFVINAPYGQAMLQSDGTSKWILIEFPQLVTSVAGRTGAVVLAVGDVSGAAPLASPTFTGVPAAPTPGAGTSSTQIATTAFVAVSYAPLASPALTGVPTAPTATGGTNNTQIATTQFVVTALSSYVPNSQLGVASGVATLDGSGKLTASQIPSSLVGGLNYQGTWNASTNTPTLTSSTGTKGYYYKVSVAGSTNLDGTTNWNVGDMATYDGTTWDKIDGPAEAVTTVAGRIGAVVLAVTDVSGAAPLASPTFTGTPAAPTASFGTSTTQLATTAFVAVNYAPLASPSFTGTPTAPTATVGTNNTQIATTQFVTSAISAGAYTLPPATVSTLGGVIIGTGIAVTGGGTISLASGAAATNVGTLGGVLTGTLPNPGLATASVTAAHQAVNLTSGESAATTPPGGVVYISAAGTFKLAQADTLTNASAIGLAVASISAAASGNIATEGVLTLTTVQWDAVTGQIGGLTAGSTYYVDPSSPGKITTTNVSTTGQVSMQIGRALSTTQMSLNIGSPILL